MVGATSPSFKNWSLVGKIFLLQLENKSTPKTNSTTALIVNLNYLDLINGFSFDYQ